MRIHPLTEEGMKNSKAKLAALREADKIRRDTSQAKNDLESYILKVKQTRENVGGDADDECGKTDIVRPSHKQCKYCQGQVMIVVKLDRNLELCSVVPEGSD